MTEEDLKKKPAAKKPAARKAPAKKADKSTVARIIGLVKGRVSFVKELWDQGRCSISETG